MNKTTFYATCPKTRAEFVLKFNTDYRFRCNAQNFGFVVMGDCVIFPNGKVANARVR